MNLSEQQWRQAILSKDSTIREAIENLDRVSIKIVLVVNKLGVLEGTVSDGDIRRALLKGLDLHSPLSDVIHRNALVVSPDMTRELVIQLMTRNQIYQIPVVDEKHHVIGLHLLDEINTPFIRPNLMVIMAGGMGTRLLPYTENCPKPLLKVAGKPMLEIIIERAKLQGFNNFILAIHYLGYMIEDYFGNGENLGVKIDYLREDFPLGTAGALGLVNPLPKNPFIVTNGDVITDIRYDELLDFHKIQSATASMAVRTYEWQNPFGVVQTKGIEIKGFEEKPVVRSLINAGIYVFNPEALSVLVPHEHCDMPLLFERLKTKNERIIAYPIHEPWMDVGRPDDLS